MRGAAGGEAILIGVDTIGPRLLRGACPRAARSADPWARNDDPFSTSRHVSLFFAVLPGDFQRTKVRKPQKSWFSHASASEITAKHRLFRRCFSLFSYERAADVAKISRADKGSPKVSSSDLRFRISQELLFVN